MRRVLAVGPAALGLALAIAVGGCGATGNPALPAGASVFADSCSVCHSLVGNETRRTQGGDLVGYRLSRAVLTQFTAEMPVRRRLTPAELAAVVSYVQAAERHHR
jgi:mono/diheme cytochrome c family protein